MKWLCPILLCPLLFAGSLPRIIYTKSFPGSVPAFVAITLDQSGAGDYKEAADDDSPLKFQLKEAEVQEIFGLADKLGRFSHSLESPLKVAFMGLKTLRYEADQGVKGEVKFNFSEDADARAILDWFER